MLLEETFVQVQALQQRLPGARPYCLSRIDSSGAWSCVRELSRLIVLLTRLA